MRPQPLICVRDVKASSRWCQRLLGRLVLQLHRWEEEHHHGRIGDPDDLPPGNGLLGRQPTTGNEANLTRSSDFFSEGSANPCCW
jgi:hypothetical protein